MSKLDKVLIQKVPITHEDERRQMYEIHEDSTLVMKNSRVIRVKQPATGTQVRLGGHWEEGVEKLYILEGVMKKAKFADIETEEERIEENLQSGTQITIPKHVAHAFYFDAPAILVVLNEVTSAIKLLNVVSYPYKS